MTSTSGTVAQLHADTPQAEPAEERLQTEPRRAPDRPGEDDKRIGARVRFWRRTVNRNPKQLARRLNITYQQLQKYEKGVNRISASRLYMISRELQIPIGYFYQDLEPISLDALNRLSEAREEELGKAAEFISEKTSKSLCRALNAIKNAQTRRAIVELILDLATRRQA